MSRMSGATPMRAYDHVANLIRDAAGEDGVVSRADASALVEGLRAEGRGHEALAAERVFAQIDARDAGPGARVTGYDLTRDRSYFSGLFRAADANANGLSKAERATLDATGKALVELGQTLAMPASRGRVAHATAELGLFHVAGLLRGGAGPDLVLSRDDRARLVDTLKRDGRGAEALAVESFGDFIDHRDAAPGARVTDADIGRAVAYARQTMLKDHDANQNGYGRAELEGMSKSSRAFVLLGQMIEAGIVAPASAPTGEGVQRVLSGLVKEQYFDQRGSEAEMPIVAIRGAGEHARTTEAAFREAFGIPNKPIEVKDAFTQDDLKTFIETNRRAYVPGEGYRQTPAATAAAVATSAALRGLDDLRIFVTGVEGESQRATYIVGRAPDDTLVGLRTSVIWT